MSSSQKKDSKMLLKLGKVKLLDYCKSLGLEVSEKDRVKDLVQWILDEVEDLNTWMEAKANVKSDMKKMKSSPGEKSDKGVKDKMYKGKCVKTGEKLYA